MPLSSLLKASLISALTAILSIVVLPVPFSPVPVTGQTFGVMLAGSVLEPTAAAFSMLGYLALGCLGFPVFAGGQAGAGTLFGPTGGYLWGFVLGAWAIAMLTKRAVTTGRFLLANVLGGVILLHFFGVGYLSHHLNISLGKAFLMGTAPFLPGDALKALGAGFIGKRLRANKVKERHQASEVP